MKREGRKRRGAGQADTAKGGREGTKPRRVTLLNLQHCSLPEEGQDEVTERVWVKGVYRREETHMQAGKQAGR